MAMTYMAVRSFSRSAPSESGRSHFACSTKLNEENAAVLYMEGELSEGRDIHDRLAFFAVGC
jgi:hypothetical protein